MVWPKARVISDPLVGATSGKWVGFSLHFTKTIVNTEATASKLFINKLTGLYNWLHQVKELRVSDGEQNLHACRLHWELCIHVHRCNARSHSGGSHNQTNVGESKMKVKLKLNKWVEKYSKCRCFYQDSLAKEVFNLSGIFLVK